MSRIIDADALYEKTAEWEASAFAYIEELNREPLWEMDEDEKAEWRRWTAILGERSAFKHDVADAPAIDAVEVARCGIVTLTDGEREYEIAEHEAWRVGDRAECIMLTRGTEDKSDDEIIEATYVWRK